MNKRAINGAPRPEKTERTAGVAARAPAPTANNALLRLSRGGTLSESARSLQRAVGNRTAARLLSGARTLGKATVQRRRLPHGGAGQVVDLVKRLLLSGNKTMAEEAISVRVRSGEMDQEDVDDVGGQLTGARDATVGRAAALKQPHSANVTSFFDGLASFMATRRGEAAAPDVAPVVTPDKPLIDKYVEKAPGPGKARVQVPATDAGAVLKATSSIRWSQSDVKATTSKGRGSPTWSIR